MLAFISLILVIIGSFNWFCIGVLQFDFVAGLFGSQSNIFSRLIYVLIGIASIVMIYNLIANKGKVVASFKQMKQDISSMKDEKQTQKASESSTDMNISQKDNSKKDEKSTLSDNKSEASTDNSLNSQKTSSINKINSHLNNAKNKKNK